MKAAVGVSGGVAAELARCRAFGASSLQLKSKRPLQRPLAYSRTLRVVALSTNDLKNGMAIEMDGAPWKVLEFLHVKPGKGSAFVRTTLKNCITGSNLDKTFRAGEKVEQAILERSIKQHTYMDGDDFVFMDVATYEEERMSARVVGDKSKWLLPEMNVEIVKWGEQVIGIELPDKVTLLVTDTDPGLKGDTAAGGSKPAKVETGATVTVPLFVNIGDKLIIDTRDGSYVSRG